MVHGIHTFKSIRKPSSGQLSKHIVRESCGFTLVELLVVIAIIGILVALLLPAVQAARESARRTQCQNNIKQVALACISHHDAKEVFPAGSEWELGLPTKEYGTTNQLKPNWLISILPYMEQQTIYDSFDFRVSIADPVNMVARSTSIPTLQCPSDSGHDTLFDGSGGTGNLQDQGANWARGNYAANSENAALGAAVRWEYAADDAWSDPQRRTVLGTNQFSTIAQITDGTSNTMLVGEMRVGVSRFDVRGTWALAGPGSAFFWHGWHEGSEGSANGPNDCSVNSDDIPRCFDVVLDTGGLQALATDCMSCKLSIGSEIQTGLRSQHPGGVNIALCDGSVHWVNDDIETSRECCSTWDRLILSQDGEIGPRGF